MAWFGASLSEVVLRMVWKCDGDDGSHDSVSSVSIASLHYIRPVFYRKTGNDIHCAVLRNTSYPRVGISLSTQPSNHVEGDGRCVHIVNA